MAESTLSTSYSDLLSEVGAYLGYGSDSTKWTAKKLAEVDRYIQAGVRQFYYPPATQGVELGFQWSFLSPHTTIDTIADQSTYDLPDDLGRILGDLVYNESAYKPSIIQVSEAKIVSLTNSEETNSSPRLANVRHKAQVEGSGQRFELVLFPTPDAIYTLNYKYEAFSGKISNSNPYPLGGMRYSELVMESCLAVAEQRANDEKGQHTASFYTLLASGVAFDKRQGARYYGSMGQSEFCDNDFSKNNRADGRVTYKGNTW